MRYQRARERPGPLAHAFVPVDTWTGVTNWPSVPRWTLWADLTALGNSGRHWIGSVLGSSYAWAGNGPPTRWTTRLRHMRTWRRAGGLAVMRESRR
jgi:hypothetical protein